MKICLKTQARNAGTQHVVVNLQERLPKHLHLSCELTCNFQVDPGDKYYLLTMTVSGVLNIICQRCLGIFQHNYKNTSKLAVCADDAIAENLMEWYECVVASDDQIDLIDILTDDLYLFTPEKHLDLTDCDSEISRLICEQDELIT